MIVRAEATVAGGGRDRRRWVLLWVIGLAQLMVVLDLTVPVTQSGHLPPRYQASEHAVNARERGMAVRAEG